MNQERRRLGVARTARWVAGILATALVLGSGPSLVAAGAQPVAAAQGTAQPTAQDQVHVPTVIPAPTSLRPVPGQDFALSPDTRILVRGSERAMRVGHHLAGLLRPATGYALPVVAQGSDPGSPRRIMLMTSGDLARELGDEGYQLDATEGLLMVRAATAEGLFHGVQTLRQLLPPEIEASSVQPGPWTVPGVHVVDEPRFSWRGAMLDPARHFLTVDEVKRYLDLLALYKINTLHLHLTDDQGWRIEIDGWPRLATYGGSTEVGGGPGGYYTKEEYAEIIAYASERFITIVPEIDMPGHTNAALASYDELNCDGTAPPLYTGTEVGFSSLCIDKPSTYELLDDVIGELAAMTPGPFIHIGGDETHVTPRDDYVRFINRVEDIVSSHGKRMIGWEEISFANVSPSSVAQHWANANISVGAAAKGMDVVMSPGEKVYLDIKYDPSTELGLRWNLTTYNSVRDSYEWDPGSYGGVPESAVLGVEGPLWGETVENIEHVEFMAFPRLPGVAERGWSSSQGRSWDEYRQRLGAHGPRWDVMSVNYYRSPDVPWRPPSALSASVPDQVVYDRDGTATVPVEVTNRSTALIRGATVRLESSEASVTPEVVELDPLPPGQTRTARFQMDWPTTGAHTSTPLVTLSWPENGSTRQQEQQVSLAVTCFADPTSPAAVTYADSEETAAEDGAAENAIDGDPSTLWHTEWSQASPGHPHEIQVDLGADLDVCAFRYLPRQSGSTTGTVADYAVYLSSDGQTWGEPVATGRFEAERAETWVPMPETTARYVRFVALSEIDGWPWTSAAEISVDATRGG